MSKFSAEDAKTCFGVDCENRPEFRVISLGKIPGKRGTLKASGPGVALMCRECMTDELASFSECLAMLNEPVGPEETEDSHFARDYAIMVVPIDLSGEDAKALIRELKTHPVEETLQ